MSYETLKDAVRSREEVKYELLELREKKRVLEQKIKQTIIEDKSLELLRVDWGKLEREVL